MRGGVGVGFVSAQRRLRLRGRLPYICPISSLYLPYICPTSSLYLPYICPTSPLYLASDSEGGCDAGVAASAARRALTCCRLGLGLGLG